MLHQTLNHLWQSTAFAGVAALLAFALRRHHARTRHAIWLAASLKFLAPFTLLTVLGTQVGTHAPLPQIASPKFAVRMDAVAAQWTAVPGVPAHGSPVPAVALLIWAAGGLYVAVRWTGAWLRMRALVRPAKLLPLPFPIPVRSAPAGIEPGIFGIFRPVLLLPAGIADRLSPAQFQAILTHEAAHVRRRDNLWSALHMLVATIFWFHPLVWFIGTRLADERERACDEEVLRLGSRAEAYAEGILAACKLYLESPLPCVSGVTGADLKKRIERIMTQPVLRQLGISRIAILTAAGAAVVCGPLLLGLLRAQEPAFDVVSIKPSKPGQFGGLLQRNPGGGFTATNIPLFGLVRTAYHLHNYQLTGGPSWAESFRFDLAAKSDRALTPEQSLLALQKLLADRFHLVLTHESRELPVYALVVAKRGPKIQKLNRPPQEGDGDFRAGGGHIVGQGASMWDFAGMLTIILDHAVTDATGLDGIYDLKLNWTPENYRAPDPNRREANGLPPPEPNGPSIFTALEEQLGLKLEPRKGPVDVYVISRAEKPTEN